MLMNGYIAILPRSDVSKEEFDLIAEQLKSQQLDVRLKKGAVSYKLGTLTYVRVGREALFGNMTFNPKMKLVLTGEGDSISAKHVEWVPP